MFPKKYKKDGAKSTGRFCYIGHFHLAMQPSIFTMHATVTTANVEGHRAKSNWDMLHVASHRFNLFRA